MTKFITPIPHSAPQPMPSTGKSRRVFAGPHALALTTLTLLFALRVFGQILVAFCHVPYLPPMEHWMSGLMPYWLLLPCQIALLVLMGTICVHAWRGHGRFARTSAAIVRRLKIGGIIYLVAVIARYAITMALYPQMRWLGGCIPIVFHLVLATFVLILARYHRNLLVAK